MVELLGVTDIFGSAIEIRIVCGRQVPVLFVTEMVASPGFKAV